MKGGARMAAIWAIAFASILPREFPIFDDQGRPCHVRIWGWGREGRGKVTSEAAKFGRESVEVLSPHPLAGAVIAPQMRLTTEALPWSRTFLCFYIKRAEGERGTQFNVEISTVGEGWADCYFSVDFSKADSEGWAFVRLPIVKFRNFPSLRGRIRSVRFCSAGRPGEHCRRFFVDRVYFEVAERPAVPPGEEPRGEVRVDKRVLVAGFVLRIAVRLPEPCGVLLRVVRRDGSVGREIWREREAPEGLHIVKWEGLGDPIREPWGELRWGRVDRRFLPDGEYVLLATLFRPTKKGLVARDFEIPLRLVGFGDEREIRLYHKPPGFWPHACRVRLVGGEKELTLRQELTPSAFGSLFPWVFSRIEGLDITEEGLVLGRSAPENLALKAKVRVCAEQNPGATWGGWRGLVDGGEAWWVTPRDFPPSEPVWFELTLPKEALVAKVMVKQARGVEERNRIRRLRLRFDDGSEVVLELPKDLGCHWFEIEPPRRTRTIRAEAIEFWGRRGRGHCGLAEFQVFEFKRYERGFFETDDIMPIGLTRWVRFKGLGEGGGRVAWEYSLDHGESWHPIPRDGDLSRVPRKWGVIRFRCTVEGEAVVKGFELTWRFDPRRPIARPLDPRWCALTVRDGAFYNRKGERVRLFGWCYSPPFAPKGYTHIGLEGWLADREREIASFAAYGINCVRLQVAGTLYLPDAESAFPGTPKYAEVMVRNGYCPLFPRLVDETIRLLAKYGIYTIFEFHDNPPWGYWSPIPASGARKHPDDYPKAFEFARPRIAKLWRWVARHFKGNPFIVGFEVPWNEPVIGQRPWDIRSREDSLRYDRIYRALVEECVKAIKSEDPQRICILGPNGWNGIRNDDPWIPPSSYWLLPGGVEAFHFHSYPQHVVSREGTMCEWFAYPRAAAVPIVRTEGHCRYFFWNKLDTAPGWGKRGVDSMLAQEFAMGIEGTVGWGHGGGERNLFGNDFCRYHAWCRFWREVAPRKGAEVAIVMDSERRHHYEDKPPHPAVEALLRLHVVPFDFLFDNCAIVKREWLKRYKALVLVPDGLPEKVVKAVRGSGIPAFDFDPKRKVDEILSELSAFLKRCGVFVDDKSPSNLLIAYGDKGLVVYERKGEGGDYTVFLRLPVRGKVRLVDECTEEVLYEGPSEKLWRKGLKIFIKPFRARLIRMAIPKG